MDARRLLIPAALGLLLSSCALWRPDAPVVGPDVPAAPAPIVIDAPQILVAAPPEPGLSADGLAAVVPDPTSTARPYVERSDESSATPVGERQARLAANRSARAVTDGDGFVGGVRIFEWAAGRIFEVRAAPLRVTTLSLAPGERLFSKAAGDTLRWQIGEMRSGSGEAEQTHVVLKPLERGLETNLILTTNRRVYHIELNSVRSSEANAAIAWTTPEAAPVVAAVEPLRDPDPHPVAMPAGEPDGRYRIEPEGRRARWTPTAVFNDGLRTFITFDPDLQVDEAPALFVIAPDGERQLVNYRQVGGLFVVDRLFDRAELKLGDRRPQVVTIRRISGARS
jgi:type IV secretion system protein TrbG